MTTWGRIAAVLVLGALLAAPAGAEMPYPPNPAPCGGSETDGPCIAATDYGRYLFLPTTEPATLPDDFPSPDDAWKLTSEKTGVAAIDARAQELYGVKGASVDHAWRTTTGRPDVVLAVIDSGIRWAEPQADLINKFYLNRAELPVPEGSTNTVDPHDRNGDGFFTIGDYLESGSFARDSRLSDQNDNGVIDPEDLIFLFSDGVDDDHNGYVDDISGWDFFEDDNDPLDEVRYGHGTGESHDSAAEGNNGVGGIGVCPNCLLLEVRAGDSFVADVNNFAQGVVFAVDSGARVIQEALGTLNQTTFGQQAVDYAWRNGVLVVASAADEESNHHNYPANYNHTLEVNSVTRWFKQSGIEQSPHSYLYLNGCTNYGGHIHLAVPSDSCSSEATGLSSGMAALVVAAAQNGADAGTVAAYRRDDGSTAPFVLSAEEVRQILLSTADDINFDARTDVDPPEARNYSTTVPVPGAQHSERFPSIAGWDQYFGYGRVNAERAVGRVAAGDIPPEAAFDAPAWFDVIDPGSAGEPNGQIVLRGRAAAQRATSFSYVLDVAPGIQPAEADFVAALTSPVQTSAVDGELGSVDIATLAARMPNGVEGPALDAARKPDPDRFSFTVRLRVTDSRGRVGEDRRTLALHHDGDLVGAGPRQMPIALGSDGVSAPATADLDGDGQEEIILGASSGEVRVFTMRRTFPDPPKERLTALEGWPVRTAPLELHTGSRGFASGEVDSAVATAIIGPTVVGDIDRDGWLEVLAADMQGRVYAWNHDGSLRPGFPVETLSQYSNTRGSERDLGTPEGRVPDRLNRHDRDNRLARGIVGGLSLGNLDSSPDGSLEIVAGGLDRHVYGWHADGTPVLGWPVLVKDPEKVAGVDPATDEVTLKPGSGGAQGTKIVAAPSLGDLDGDGELEVVTVTNEAYHEPTNAIFESFIVNLFISTGALDPGNTRVYAIHHDGVAHGASAQTRGWNPNAFVAGWPVKTSLLVPELLPFVGDGSNGPPALADVDHDGKLEVATFSAVGPAYLFRADGSPYFGTEGGVAKTFDSDTFGGGSDSTDAPSFATLGAPVLAEFGGVGGGFHLLAPATGLGKFLDNQLPARQTPADNHLGAWSITGDRAGRLLEAYPRVLNDLQFFGSPAVGDVDGDGKPEAIEGSGVYDLHAFNIDGVEPEGWPRFTGGWMIGSPALGDIDGDGLLEVVAVTREGNLFVWHTQGPECGVLWRRWHHDEWGTGNYHTDTRPPGPVLVDASLPLTAVRSDAASVGLLRLPSDDLWCEGNGGSIQVRYDEEPIDSEAKFAGATLVSGLTVGRHDPPALSGYLFAVDPAFSGRSLYFAAVALDEAGNRSPLGQLGQASFPPAAPTETATPSFTPIVTPTATPAVAASSTPTTTAVAASGGGGCSATPGPQSGAWPAVALLLCILLMRGVRIRQARAALHKIR